VPTDEIAYTTIDGVDYTCEMMPALQANTVLLTLIDIVGRPALVVASEAFDEMENRGDGTVLVGGLVRLGVEQVFARLTPQQGSQVLLTMMNGTRFRGCAVHDDLSIDKVFDKHFRGRLLSAYKVWAWALKVNYRDFFDAARSNGMVSGLLAAGESALSKAGTLTRKSPESATMAKAEST